jgi:sulfur-oxidizing protein SoxX
LLIVFRYQDFAPDVDLHQNSNNIMRYFWQIFMQLSMQLFMQLRLKKKENMMKKYSVVLLAGAFISLTACDSGPDSPKGFSLPRGDVERGQQVLIKHQCLACHTIQDVTLDGIEPELEQRIQLGGERTGVTTYAELVTSVINPSHRIAGSFELNTQDETGISKMRNYNDVMTVAELVDLVEYLQPHYKVKPHEYTSYGRYY